MAPGVRPARSPGTTVRPSALARSPPRPTDQGGRCRSATTTWRRPGTDRSAQAGTACAPGPASYPWAELPRFRPGWAHGRAKPTTCERPGADVGVPNVEIRTGNPVAYASIILPRPITRPTCPGEVGVPSDPAKNTRSPGSTLPAGTCGNWAH